MKILPLVRKCTVAFICGVLLSGATIVPDSYDKLFLRCNGTTTTFVDSSTANPKTITGNATQLSLHSDFSGKRTAMFFNGTTDMVMYDHSADWHLEAGDWSTEAYICRNVAGAAHTIWSYTNATNDWLHQFGVTSGNKLTLYLSQGGSIYINISSTASLDANTWYKVRATKVGTSYKLYINDVEDGSGTNSTTMFAADNPIRVGGIGTGANFNGWIKNLTIIKAGTTVLDMRGDTGATSPLGPAIYFDGTGDYLDFSDSADFAPGTGAFSVEGFLNTGVPATAQTIYDTRTATSNTTGFLINIASSKLCFTTATTARITGGTTLIANRTYHWRVVGNGGADGARTVTLYLNGQVEGTAYTNNYNFTDQTLRIGSIKAAAGTAFNGWMREIRVSNSERNTTAFTPSQTGFTVDANTKLYIKGNEDNGVGGNGSTDIKDSSTSPKVVTCVNDTKIKYTEDYRSCIFKDETGKFPYPVGSAKVDFMAIGSGVGYFDGTGDALSIADSTDWDFSTGDFTLEGFIRWNTVAATYIIHRKTGASGNLCDFSYEGSGDWNFYINNADRLGVVSLTPLAYTWYHFAAIRTGTTTKVFINGTQLGNNGTDSYDIQGDQPYYIGAFSNLSTNCLNGLMDNIRISKGIARYTATFNPPDDYSAPRIGKRKTNWFFFF